VTAQIDRYMDRGSGGFANLILTSGERIFLSLSPKGLRVHNLILWGRIPGRTLYVADAAAVAQMVKVFVRDVESLPKLPDKAAMDSFLVTAMSGIKDPATYGRYPADEEGNPMTTLAVLTRGVLDEPDQAGVVRRLSRAAATPA
jgi:hypothetical protein